MKSSVTGRDFALVKYVGRHVTFECGGRVCTGTVKAADGLSASSADLTVESDDYMPGQTVRVVMRATNTREFGPCTPQRAAPSVIVGASFGIPAHWGW